MPPHFLSHFNDRSTCTQQRRFFLDVFISALVRQIAVAVFSIWFLQIRFFDFSVFLTQVASRRPLQAVHITGERKRI